MDRDGTIGGSDSVIYPGDFKLFSDVAESIQQLKKSGVLICLSLINLVIHLD